MAWTGTAAASTVNSFGKGLASILVGDKLIDMAKSFVSKKTAKKSSRRVVKKSKKASKSYASAGSDGVNQLAALNFYPNGHQVGSKTNRQFVQFVYNDIVSLSSSTSGLASTPYVFSLNGAYDPDVTGTGHQPRGFDQWMALYKRFKVYKADVEIRFSVPTNATNYKVNGCWRVTNPSTYAQATAGYRTSDFIEQSEAGAIACFNSGEQSYVRFTVSIPLCSGLKGIKDPQFNDQFTGSDSGNPGNAVYMQLCCTNDTATDNTVCAAQVTIRYHTMLYNDVMLLQS